MTSVTEHKETMMIDTIEQQTTCKACGKPLVPSTRPGPRKKEYCDDTCRQRAHRAKSKQPPASTVTNVTMGEKQHLEQRIAELERQLETLKSLRSRRSSPDVQARHLWQYRAMECGHKLGYPSLHFEISTKAGVKAWQAFVKDASEDTLIRLVMAAEEYSNRDKS